MIFFFFWQGGLSAAPARAVSAVKNMNLPEIPRNINIGDINIKVPSLSPFWAAFQSFQWGWFTTETDARETARGSTAADSPAHFSPCVYNL